MFLLLIIVVPKLRCLTSAIVDPRAIPPCASNIRTKGIIVKCRKIFRDKGGPPRHILRLLLFCLKVFDFLQCLLELVFNGYKVRLSALQQTWRVILLLGLLNFLVFVWNCSLVELVWLPYLREYCWLIRKETLSLSLVFCCFWFLTWEEIYRWQIFIIFLYSTSRLNSCIFGCDSRQNRGAFRIQGCISFISMTFPTSVIKRAEFIILLIFILNCYHRIILKVQITIFYRFRRLILIEFGLQIVTLLVDRFIKESWVVNILHWGINILLGWILFVNEMLMSLESTFIINL